MSVCFSVYIFESSLRQRLMIRCRVFALVRSNGAALNFFYHISCFCLNCLQCPLFKQKAAAWILIGRQRKKPLQMLQLTIIYSNCLVFFHTPKIFSLLSEEERKQKILTFKKLESVDYSIIKVVTDELNS